MYIGLGFADDGRLLVIGIDLPTIFREIQKALDAASAGEMKMVWILIHSKLKWSFSNTNMILLVNLSQ